MALLLHLQYFLLSIHFKTLERGLIPILRCILVSGLEPKCKRLFDFSLVLLSSFRTTSLLAEASACLKRILSCVAVYGWSKGSLVVSNSCRVARFLFISMDIEGCFEGEGIYEGYKLKKCGCETLRPSEGPRTLFHYSLLFFLLNHLLLLRKALLNDMRMDFL